MRYYIGVIKHKYFVMLYMLQVCNKLIIRSLRHDLSKFSYIEANGFHNKLGTLSKTQYGTKEYNELLDSEKPTLQHHYSRNSHHPEFYGGDIGKMSMLDLIEMQMDWRASLKKNINGNIERSFKINKERFNISDEMIRLLKTL
jgi:hypothetical protein